MWSHTQKIKVNFDQNKEKEQNQLSTTKDEDQNTEIIVVHQFYRYADYENFRLGQMRYAD